MSGWIVRRRPIKLLVALGLFWFAPAGARAPAGEGAAAPPGTNAAHAAHEVFEDSAFWWKRIHQVEAPAVPASWLERILRAIGDLFGRALRFLWDLLQKFLESLFGLPRGDWSSATPLVWLVAAALIAWVLWKLYPLLAQWLRTGEAGPGQGEAPEHHPLPEGAALLRQAERAFQDGRYPEAVRLAFLALIARLQNQGLLRYNPARTNREYQHDLRPVPELAVLFGEVARPYEGVWYGQLPATRGDAEQVLRRCRPAVTEEPLSRE